MRQIFSFFQILLLGSLTSACFLIPPTFGTVNDGAAPSEGGPADEGGEEGDGEEPGNPLQPSQVNFLDLNDRFEYAVSATPGSPIRAAGGVFRQNCISCHANPRGSTPNAANTITGVGVSGINLATATEADFIAGGWVVPGNPAASPLLQFAFNGPNVTLPPAPGVQAKDMPTGGWNLGSNSANNAAVAALVDWISLMNQPNAGLLNVHVPNIDNSDWNAADNPVALPVGGTLRVRDLLGLQRQIHTTGNPFPHQGNPGGQPNTLAWGFTDFTGLTAVNSSVKGQGGTYNHLAGTSSWIYMLIQ